MEQFLELFGTYSFLGITVYKWFLIGGALVFLVKSGKKAATMIGDLYERKKRIMKYYIMLSNRWHSTPNGTSRV